jgi:uncharacterized protein YggU (UPF0235/DUF167 family)
MKGRRAAQPSSSRSIVITVRAKPRSPVSALDFDASGTWVAQLRAAPADGKANAELIALVAERFGCPRSAVSLVSGASARLKLLRIVGVSSVLPSNGG